MTGLDAAAVRRRYLTLLVLRWLPVGLLVPVTVLLATSRGLSLAQIGVVFSVQGFVVFGLELPTGGLSDAVGRRTVLVVSCVFGLASLGLLYVARSFPVFVAALALQGVFRALDSGPLEAWYVDATLAAAPGTRLDAGLSAGTVALSGGIGAGAVLSGVLVALRPFPGVEPLAGPLLVSLVLGVANLAAVALLVTEVRPARGLRAVAASARQVPRIVADGLRLLRASRVLLALVLVEAFWGFGMVTFEALTPLRLGEVVHDTERAAVLMGPVSSAAWFASAAGGALVTLVSRRAGVAPTAAALRIVQGLTVVGMGLLTGPVGVVTGYLACYLIHGASNPLHTALLHDQASEANRTTVLSMNSMIGQTAYAVGSILLAALADGTSLSVALVVGAVALAAAAPLYLPAWRAEQTSPMAAAAAVEPLPASLPTR